MQAQDTAPTVEQDNEADRAVLAILLDSPRPLAVAEVTREAADPLAAKDSVSRLVAVGLAHNLDGFVFASRAAVHSDGLG